MTSVDGTLNTTNQATIIYFHEMKIECSIQRGEAKLNRTIHLSPNENICTIPRMKNVHYLFNIASKILVIIQNA